MSRQHRSVSWALAGALALSAGLGPELRPPAALAQAPGGAVRPRTIWTRPQLERGLESRRKRYNELLGQARQVPRLDPVLAASLTRVHKLIRDSQQLLTRRPADEPQLVDHYRRIDGELRRVAASLGHWVSDPAGGPPRRVGGPGTTGPGATRPSGPVATGRQAPGSPAGPGTPGTASAGGPGTSARPGGPTTAGPGATPDGGMPLSGPPVPGSGAPGNPGSTAEPAGPGPGTPGAGLPPPAAPISGVSDGNDEARRRLALIVAGVLGAALLVAVAVVVPATLRRRRRHDALLKTESRLAEWSAPIRWVADRLLTVEADHLTLLDDARHQLTVAATGETLKLLTAFETAQEALLTRCEAAAQRYDEVVRLVGGSNGLGPVELMTVERMLTSEPVAVASTVPATTPGGTIASAAPQSLPPEVLIAELSSHYRRSVDLLSALGSSVGVLGPHDEEGLVDRRVERALSRWKPRDRTVAGDFTRRADVAAAVERGLAALRAGDVFTAVREVRRARERRLIPSTEPPTAPKTAISEA